MWKKYIPNGHDECTDCIESIPVVKIVANKSHAYSSNQTDSSIQDIRSIIADQDRIIMQQNTDNETANAKMSVSSGVIYIETKAGKQKYNYPSDNKEGIEKTITTIAQDLQQVV